MHQIKAVTSNKWIRYVVEIKSFIHSFSSYFRPRYTCFGVLHGKPCVKSAQNT